MVKIDSVGFTMFDIFRIEVSKIDWFNRFGTHILAWVLANEVKVNYNRKRTS